ncbi:reverse transcriptase domain-containing protein [Tanacetum coccineum]|uniref:Reverse transcriptase domain-containing protein n=1 Tax=Tanacetum coccineum TaxID=301880 RepID=A0ABQ5IB53_9ASTR
MNAVFTRSGKSYNPTVNPNDQQDNSKTLVNFDSDIKDEEPTPQPKTQNPKTIKETPFPKPYKPKIPHPQRLRKEKMEAQYGKFLDMIRTVRINVPLIDTFSCNALADLAASINLMPYSLYAKLSLETLKPTKISIRLADRSFQYLVGIAENMLIEVGKVTFPADFIILEMEEDIGTERMIFNIDSAMKHSYSNDDTCFSIDVIDEILEEHFDILLNEGSKILHSIEGTILEEEIFVEFDGFMAMTADENSDSESDTKDPPFEKITINTDYKIKTSLVEPPTDLELEPLPDNLEYVFLKEPSFLPVIISSKLSKEKKNKLVSVLKKHKKAFTWKTTDIPVIRENVYPAIGNRDHTQAVIALMLYCLKNRQPFNLAYFIVRRMYFFRDRRDKVLPYGMILTRLFENLKENMAQGSFDERYKLVPKKMSSFKAKQPKKPLPKRTRNVGKSKLTQLTTSSSTKSPPSDNGDLPSTKLSPRSYHMALKDDPNMSKEQRETRVMFKNLGRALHKFSRMSLKNDLFVKHFNCHINVSLDC